MKKVWKYILSIFITIILATGGIIYYFFNIKEYDIEDEKIKEIVETVYKIILPGESIDEENVIEDHNNTNIVSNSNPMSNNSNTNSTTTEMDKSITSNNDHISDTSQEKNIEDKTNSSNSKPTNNLTKTTEKSKTNKPNKNHIITKPITQIPNKVTAESIKAKYRPVFLSLQSQANGKLDALVGAAISEYQSKKANGESISYSYFYQKYSSAGRALEGNTDNAFYFIYGALESELKKHGFDSSHAAIFKQQYAAAKKARESSLISYAKQGL